MRNIDEIIVHCSATRESWMDGQPVSAKVEEIRRWHVEDNGWSDIGYHFLIDRDGSIAKGREVDVQGAHCRGHNATTIGICLIGGHGSNENDTPSEHFTAVQMAALRTLIDRMREEFPAIRTVSGHNQYAAKACPGFNVGKWLGNQKPRTNPAQSTTLQATAAVAASGVTAAGTAIGALDGTAQIVVIVCFFALILGCLWIARERLARWARGDR